ncbi:hydroxymethylbilane synthase [soil metagenome]
MPLRPLRLGTRGSPLALWQARHVAALLQPYADPRPVELVRIETDGDRDQATALSAMGGFGVFTKAIQNALLANTVDLAVHSLKDLPTIATEGLMLAATPSRGPTGDAFLSTKYKRFDDLPKGASVGTSSLRRRAMILNRRPDLNLVALRGNVDTRIRKLSEQNLDAIVLAEAGLKRLGLADQIVEVLDECWLLPAVGQGAIGLECRSDDHETLAILNAINDAVTWLRVTAERAMLATLGGGCLVPIGVTTKIVDWVMTLRGAVLGADGGRKVVATYSGPASSPLANGQETAAMLIDEGARELLL